MFLLRNYLRFTSKNKIEAICCANIGKRVTHEDNFFLNGEYLLPKKREEMKDCRTIGKKVECDDEVCVFAVSDGMGGHNAGEVASLLCVEQLTFLKRKLQVCSSLDMAVVVAQEYVNKINILVCEKSEEDRSLKGMGATLVLIIVFKDRFAVLNLGDSRAYQYRDGTLKQITKDNTEGQRMLDLGLLSRKELEKFPARNNLNKYVGYGHNNYVLKADYYGPFDNQGILVLCSDGISNYVSDECIKEVLWKEKSLMSVGKQLVEIAAANQEADNSTIILISFAGR